MMLSAYLGQHPEKVAHAVLAEPGFLTSELAENFAKATAIHYSPGIVYHFVITKFESLHVKGSDAQAADDYFGYEMNMYQGSDHPQSGYRCEGGGPKEGEKWRYGAQAAGSFYQQALDADGHFNVNLVKGVDGFTSKVLFMASECQKIIGVDWQKKQMGYFPNAELAVVPNAGHETFVENPETSIAVVREYLDAPVK